MLLCDNVNSILIWQDKLLCSQISSEYAIGSIVKDEIMPVVEELEKVHIYLQRFVMFMALGYGQIFMELITLSFS